MFTITSDLPTGPLLLEASAGTGKTWTIAALTARFIAETNTRMDEFLLITFSNKAAQELRSSVFTRLQKTEAALGSFLDSGQAPDDADTVSVLLCQGDVEQRRQRLRTALDSFDTAMIVTTHVFCQSMLKELGVLGDWDVGENILSDPRSLIDQCATDVYVSRYQDVSQPTLDPRRALTIAREACLSTLEVTSQYDDDEQFCEEVRQRFAARKRTMGLVTFDDLTSRLHDVLVSPSAGDWAVEALQDRFAVVLVDEFQDTDPQQWQIIKRAFVSQERVTVLIGDPKQSIYGFRNADLMSYLDAAQQIQKLSLPCNHRSDEAVVNGVQELFGNLPLGDPTITVVDVESRHKSRLDMPGPARLLLRRGNADTLKHPPHESIAHDMVALALRVLDLARVTEDDGTSEALRPCDLAVLVRNRARGAELVDALRDAGIPAVFHGQEDVLTSDAAQDWAMLLAAMIAPTRSNIVLAAATDLLGFAFSGLVDGGQDSVAASVLVHRLIQAHACGGVPEVLTVLVTDTGLDARVLARPDGERVLTDLHHVAELLSGSGIDDLNALEDWLRHARDGMAVDGAETRLASDAPAVRVTTMHSAKGLQFGVVLLPEVSDLIVQSRKPFPVVLDGKRYLHVGPPLDFRDPTRKEFERQQREEELRLLYVALTRAKYMTIAWHVVGKRSQTGSLTALLSRDRSTTTLNDRYARVPSQPSLNPALIHISDLDDTQPRPVPQQSIATAALTIARMNRQVDQVWRRTSYSGLTAGLYELGHTPVHGDEPAEVDVFQPPPSPGMDLPSPMAHLPSGAAFGTLVHAALEELDWSPSALADSAAQVVERLAPRFGMGPEDSEVLTASLVQICSTPLGPLADGVALRDIPLGQRLPELDFDMPMSELGTSATVGDLADLMAAHLPATDPLSAYPAHLRSSPAAGGILRGFLTGSIDAVLQTPSQKYVVVDYKTNRLPTGPGEELTVGHYQGPAMAEAMMQAHYPLQALLYSVALHRFLAWRLPGYSPDKHLGGAGYLFVRGMAGEDAPEVAGMPCGVFTWHPPTALVLAASEIVKGTP